MLSIFISSVLLIIGIFLSIIGVVGLGFFFLFVILWIVEGETGFYVEDKEMNPWVFTLSWFAISLFIASLGLTIFRIVS